MTNSVLIIINYSHINIETSIWGKNSSNDQGINLLFQLLVINIGRGTNYCIREMK